MSMRLDVLPENPRRCTMMGACFELVAAPAPGEFYATGGRHDRVQPGVSGPRDARSRSQLRTS